MLKNSTYFQIQKPCRVFQQTGHCPLGASCNFEHNRASGSGFSQPSFGAGENICQDLISTGSCSVFHCLEDKSSLWCKSWLFWPCGIKPILLVLICLFTRLAPSRNLAIPNNLEPLVLGSKSLATTGTWKLLDYQEMKNRIRLSLLSQLVLECLNELYAHV